MATLAKDDIAKLADEWAGLMAEIEPLAAKADELDLLIRNWLRVHGRPVRIEGKRAIAEFAVIEKFGSRQIDVKAFLQRAAGHGDAAYECLSVAVAKAEKLLGETAINEISDRSVSETKKITLEMK